MPPVQRAAPGSLPLTVIGGFLGAGKTTLLNHLLGAPHGRRLAVLVNDFGPINIDAALIRSRSEDTISLANGCACCSVAGDLTRALIELAQRDEPPDAIVLEASGLADPHGIAQVALANPALRLDGVLT
ncbi:MAG: GTP-binding protein, partial [Betaproteobacteria bacterium]|nr:GTP-binding protein [Betaproteobacteria bacterium]